VVRAEIAGRLIVNRTLTRFAQNASIAHDLAAKPRALVDQALERTMQRLRLKADGRIVELRDGQEFPLAPAMSGVGLASPGVALAVPAKTPAAPLPAVRDLRRRARLTQLEFAARLGVPVETIRNWEQGKRAPRGPARALLAVIAHAPDTVFAALATEPASA
jgi:putative transcriptional regulator